MSPGRKLSGKVVTRIFKAIGFLLLTAAAGSAAALESRSTTTTVLKFAPYSAGARGVAAWLDDRKAQNQFTFDPNVPGEIAGSNITVEIVTASIGGVNLRAANGGTALPATGTVGQQITITDCTGGQSTTTTVYLWACDKDGCSWQQIDYTARVSKSVVCGE